MKWLFSIGILLFLCLLSYSSYHLGVLNGAYKIKYMISDQSYGDNRQQIVDEIVMEINGFEAFYKEKEQQKGSCEELIEDMQAIYQ